MLKKGYLKYLYIISMCLAMFTKLPGIELVWYKSYIHCMLWIGLGIFFYQRNKYCNSKKKSDTYDLWILIKIFMIPYLVFWIVTPFGWMQHLPDFKINAFTRAISTTLQFSLILMSATATAYIFREKLLSYTFTAMIINYLLVIVRTISYYGMDEFVRTGLYPWDQSLFVWTSDGNVMMALEVHDLTFAVGFLIIYYLICRNENGKKEWGKIFWCVFLLYFGYKRIEIAALLAVLGTYLISKRFCRRNMRHWARIVTLAILSACFLYVWLIDSGMLTVIAEKYHIEFMGRLKVYTLMADYFEFSPLYLGRGFSSAARINDSLTLADSTVIGGHSEVLQAFINFGFLGTLIWIIFCVYYPFKILRKRYGLLQSQLWVLFTIFAFITYLTDNTMLYFSFQSCYMIVIYHLMLSSQYRSSVGNSLPVAVNACEQ